MRIEMPSAIRGLADTRLSDYQWVVFLSSAEYAYGPVYLSVPSNDRIQQPILRSGCQVVSEPVQDISFGLR